MIFPFKTPALFKKVFQSMEWNGKSDSLHLTFDDGPHPEITGWVLDLLKTHNIKATFFCVGDNVHKYPETIERIQAEGHQIANHTFNHLNGWETKKEDYLQNIQKSEDLIATSLFRPPYGRIKKSQRVALNSKFRVIMWSLLSGDFNPNLNKEKALRILCKSTGPGEIIVFHDSVKAKENLKYLLPKYLDFCKEKGFKFSTL